MGATEDLRKEVKDSDFVFAVVAMLHIKSKNMTMPNGLFVYSTKDQLREWFDDLCSRIKKDPVLKLRADMRPEKIYDIQYEKPDMSDEDEIFIRFSEWEMPIHVMDVKDQVSFSMQCVMTPINLDPFTNTDGILNVVKENAPKEQLDKGVIIHDFEQILKEGKRKWDKEHGIK